MSDPNPWNISDDRPATQQQKQTLHSLCGLIGKAHRALVKTLNKDQASEAITQAIALVKTLHVDVDGKTAACPGPNSSPAAKQDDSGS